MRNKQVYLFPLLPLVLFAAGSLQADTIFTVDLNTTPLTMAPGSTAGPFSLAFQLVQGSQASNNTATISDFAFGTGGAAGSGCAFSPCMSGGATGDITGTVNLNTSSFLNTFVEAFTPGTDLAFQVDLTTNIDSGGTPDAFAFGILDGSGTPLPTMDPSFADTLLTVNIDSSSPTILTYSTDLSRFANNNVSIDVGAPTTTPAPATVPEPSSFVLLCGVLATIAGILRRS